jgi:hypothetical protein
MTKQFTTTNLGAVLKFPFEDENWFGKLAVAVVIMLIGFIPLINIVSFALFLGYGAEITRRIAVEGQEPSLPAWDDLSAYFKNGFRLLGVYAIYTLPVVVLMTVGYFAMFIPVFLSELSGAPETQMLLMVFLGYGAGFLLMGLGSLIGMATGVVLPVIGTHVVVQDQFGAGFQVGDWWKIFKANWVGFLLSFLILFGGGMVLYYISYFLVLTVILCCLYPIAIGVMGVYLSWVGSAMFAAAYREGVEQLEGQETE